MGSTFWVGKLKQRRLEKAILEYQNENEGNVPRGAVSIKYIFCPCFFTGFIPRTNMWQPKVVEKRKKKKTKNSGQGSGKKRGRMRVAIQPSLSGPATW